MSDNIEQDAIELSTDLEGPERWHDYSTERGNESSLVAALPYGSPNGLSRDYSRTGWDVHRHWLG
jgi:hypothetical protein